MSEPTPKTSDPSLAPRKFGNSPREFSGTKLVIGLFLFAAAMSVGLWTYWYLHARPFQPLQLAIHQVFPKSYPQVQGGQLKMHRNTPRILRITLKVPFDPKPREADEQVATMVEQLEQLARQHIDFDSYELLEIHLVQRRPEHDSQTRTVTREIHPRKQTRA
jgi:hypothetical protein